MSTHTPGPWHIGMKPGPTVYGPQGEQITWSANPLLDEQEHRANQHLIAAAPELLKALKDYQTYFESMSGHPCNSVSKNAKAIITKAEGRNQ